VYIYGSYRKIKAGFPLFWTTLYISLKMTPGPNGKNGNMFFLRL